MGRQGVPAGRQAQKHMRAASPVRATRAAKSASVQRRASRRSVQCAGKQCAKQVMRARAWRGARRAFGDEGYSLQDSDRVYVV